MLKAILLALVCALVACSDNDKLTSNGKPDASHEELDGGADGDDAGDAPAKAGLELPPGSLPRPPGNKLPDELKPPDYEK